MLLLPFDAHNHIHMGPTDPVRALFGRPSTTITDAASVDGSYSSFTATTTVATISGMAIMSTHLRDFERVERLARELQRPGVVRVVPCFGVHPWWLHELTEDDWSSSTKSRPRWIDKLEDQLEANADAALGETGLDGFHFDSVTKDLVSPMDKQIEAFRLQIELAGRLRRPVSIHAVQCFGPLMETLSQLKKSKTQLPPKFYFHAFSGKAGVVDQLTAICGREVGKCYFGFAPIVNFQSPKTTNLIRKVGIK
jgi:TatD DNase family protein